MFPPSRFDMHHQDEDEEDESALIFKHIGGLMEGRGHPAPSYLKIAKQNNPNLDFLSDDSDEEDIIMREEMQEQDRDQFNAFKNVREFMKIIKQVPNKMASAGKQPVKLPQIQELSESQLSSIDPLDDPLSEALSTPLKRNNFIMQQDDLQDSFTG